ncbi:MAG TPA: sugar ABC transporter permease [Treponema sp.]|nr:sugar ABC transporter permease [Treponema sp.]
MKQTRSWSFTRNQNFWGWILIMPLTLGLIIWVFFPMGLSFVTSLTTWDMLSKPVFVGMKNYISLFTGDQLFLQSVKVTVYYTLLSVPLQLIAAFGVSMILNSNVRGIGIFRTIFYLPSLLPGVVVAVIWLWLYNNHYGLLNAMLNAIGLDKVEWISSPDLVIPSLVIMSVWSIGNIVVIFLAGLQGIPKTLLEAVVIDGGNAWHSFRNVILPLMSPLILYNLIIGIIKSLQLFTEPYIMTGGGPMNSSLTFMLLIYNNAFKYGKMGIANAMAWVLFVLTLLLSLVVMKTSSKWTYSEGDTK